MRGYHSYIPKLKQEYFRFHSRAIQDALDIFSKINPLNHTMVSIHIRLDDYADHRNKVFKIPDYVTKEYLRAAMKYFHEIYKVSAPIENQAGKFYLIDQNNSIRNIYFLVIKCRTFCSTF